MSRIDNCFSQLERSKKKALIVYVTAGDPNLDTTVRIVPELERSGADVVELGIPFSDPLADGTTIQAASTRALKRGTTLKGILSAVEKIRRRSEVPLVLMGYLNPILALGTERFFARAAAAGVDGVIIPDLPAGEMARISQESRRRGIAPIFLVAPNTPKERIRIISRESRGYIYCVSVKGVTGARTKLPRTIGSMVLRVKKFSALPVVVGFGIATPDQARWVCSPSGGKADGVVVGSALVKIIEGNKKGRSLFPSISRFVGSLRKSLS
ncbi:MAG: tryptophan synthase subunit alpha [Proteobacteria bacterium]|nr:tryptophan synthase subunit alpha [Pseudomonadota bacterium]